VQNGYGGILQMTSLFDKVGHPTYLRIIGSSNHAFTGTPQGRWVYEL